VRNNVKVASHLVIAKQNNIEFNNVPALPRLTITLFDCDCVHSAMSQAPRPNSSAASRLSTLPSQKPRQLSHLHSQLAQLTAHVSDLENLLRMTAVQADAMRGLGGYAGAMYVC
jgi:hypothetical protein